MSIQRFPARVKTTAAIRWAATRLLIAAVIAVGLTAVAAMPASAQMGSERMTRTFPVGLAAPDAAAPQAAVSSIAQLWVDMTVRMAEALMAPDPSRTRASLLQMQPAVDAAISEMATSVSESPAVNRR